MRVFAPLLLSVSLCAAEIPVVQAHLADGARAWERVQASAFMKLMQSPAMTAFQEHALKRSGLEGDAAKPWWEQAPMPASMDLVLTLAGESPRFAFRARYAAGIERAERLFAAPMEQMEGDLGTYDLHRDGEVLHFDDGAPMAWPQPLACGEDDLAARIDLATLVRTFVPNGAKTAATLKLGDLGLRLRITEQGYAESARLEGWWPALAPVDPDHLRGVPRQALFGAAVGLEGTAIERWVHAAGEAMPEVPLGLATADERLAGMGLPSLTDALFSLNGTAFLVIAPGAPFPTVTLALPAGAGIDALVDGLAERAGFDAGPARTASVMLPMPRNVPLPVVLRRSPTHWILSSDSLGIDDLAEGTGEIFADVDFTTLAGDRTPVALTWSDNQVFFRQMAGFLGMAQGQIAQAKPEEQETMRLAIAMLTEFGRHVPRSLGVVLQDEGGLDLRGENLSFSVGPIMGIAAGITLPALSMARQKAGETHVANNMRQMVTAMVALSVDDPDARFPKTLQDLQQGMDLPDRLFVSPLAKPGDPEPHFVYVRPVAEVPAHQAVLLHNPLLTKGVLLIVDADGSIRRVRGEPAFAMWNQALELSQDPVALDTGIPPERWTTDPDRAEKPLP